MPPFGSLKISLTIDSIDSHVLNISLSLLSSHCYIMTLDYLLSSTVGQSNPKN